MKKLFYLSLFSIALTACKKESSTLDTTPTLDVEERNMGVFGLRTATWCGPCGGYLDNSHDVFENAKGFAVAMAFKDAFSEAQAPFGNILFDKVEDMFGLPSSVPSSFQNFNTDFPASVNEHLALDVTVNGNYEIEFNGNEMTINTTTKFFTNFSGDVYLAPFVIVDSLVGAQLGHPDTPNTIHMKYVADVAYPSSRTSESKFEWGYLVSASDVKAGHVVNLQFKAMKRDHWKNHNISIGMIYFRRVGNEFRFLNAYTK